MAEATSARARCADCGGGLSFELWSSGSKSCTQCTTAASRTDHFVPSAAARQLASEMAPPPPPAAGPPELDIPDDLLADVAAMLDAEKSRRKGAVGVMRDVADEVELGQAPRELAFTAWGFAVGFGGNAVLAKYAQVAADAPMSDFVAPFLIGGIIAGATGAAVGWGVAKLRASF